MPLVQIPIDKVFREIRSVDLGSVPPVRKEMSIRVGFDSQRPMENAALHVQRGSNALLARLSIPLQILQLVNRICGFNCVDASFIVNFAAGYSRRPVPDGNGIAVHDDHHLSNNNRRNEANEPPHIIKIHIFYCIGVWRLPYSIQNSHVHCVSPHIGVPFRFFMRTEFVRQL